MVLGQCKSVLDIKKHANTNRYILERNLMVVKVDKSEEFIKSGKKLASEYPAQSNKDGFRIVKDGSRK